MSKGFLVYFEGIPGTGKTTQALKLVNYLNNHGFPKTIYAKNPGTTWVGEQVRNTVLHRPEEVEPFDPWTQTLLMCAAHRELLEKTVRPALEAGFIVILDRSVYTTRSIHEFGHGCDSKQMQHLLDIVTQGLEPNLLFFLDTDPKLAAARNDDFDQTDKDALLLSDKYREGYFQMILIEDSTPWRLIDAAQSIDYIHEEIVREVKEWWSTRDSKISN